MEDNIEMSNKNDSEKKNSTGKFIIELLIYALIFVFCIFVVPRYVLQRTVVDGNSMKNTLHDGESLLVEKVSRYFTDPARFDIIIFDPPAELKEDDSYFVKRIIGLPGETIQIKENDIYINGKKLEESYGRETMLDEDNETAVEPLKLADDEFFVLGDNRRESEDSRFQLLGPIKRDKLIGHAILRVWPLNEFGIPK